MKRAVIVAVFAAALAAFAVPAHAQETTVTATTTSSQTTQVGQVAGAQSINGGSNGNSNVTFEGSHIPDQTPNAIAPSFSSSGINACPLGGPSLALSFAGFGISAGNSRLDQGCALARIVNAIRSGGTPIERATAAVVACNGDQGTLSAVRGLGFTCEEYGHEILRELGQLPPTQPSSAPGSEVTASPTTIAANEEIRGRFGPNQ